jgi:nicotinamide mononucleotide transporter
MRVFLLHGMVSASRIHKIEETTMQHAWFPMLSGIEWQHLLGSTPLEVIATVAAIAGVILIARQRILGWPLGICWAGISAYLAFTQWQLVSDGILYLSYVPIQVYCWVIWARAGSAPGEGELTPAWSPRRTQLTLIIAAALCVCVWAIGIARLASQVSWIPQPALLWRDSTTTVLNFFAQFLQARKRMENWVGWLIVNILGIHIYWVKDAPIYAIQYGFFLCLGIYGWIQWNKSMKAHTS